MNGYLLIIFIGFAGFFLAAYIAHKKRRRSEHFMCPLRGNCTEVIHSSYATFLGVPVEILGLVYYASISIGYGLYLWGLSPNPPMLAMILLIASTLALVFSCYLTLVQIVALRKICTWCILSATFCLGIFLLSAYGAPQSIAPMIEQYALWL